ncbi:MAG TPA: UvrD-helicase domain-containing protein [Bacteroidales bacterium]|nr:UvrD-helicase domain-containing protein [Bacteroidales bacterium]
MSLLTIYKASAGSGKTFQLTLSYLELLFKNPDAYRHILAVTFTNKAAKEMKQRVLERLFILSSAKPGESNQDLEYLMNLTCRSRDDIIKLAGNILTRILNDYSRFSISTIDKFFQGIIRSFALELGLTPGYSVEIEQSRVLSEAIDMIYANLSEDIEMKDWILQLAESRIQASKSWRYQDDIEDLSYELFNEKFQEITLQSDDVISREHIHLLKEKVEKVLISSDKAMRDTASGLMDALRNRGLDENDFFRKSKGIVGFIKNVSEGRQISFTDTRKKAIFDEQKWLSENDRADPGRVAILSSILMPGLKEIYGHNVLWNTADSINRHIYALGIISDVAKNISSFATLKNIFLISDTARFLRGLISDNPTPFIYEKTGTYINHIMLDEFQDTSVFQWENFKPLLNHTLSSGNENLVVGDVKQSIYRWRNSDWKILGNSLKSSFSRFSPQEHNLKVNWRSNENIVYFNNGIFEKATVEAWQLITDNIPSEQLHSKLLENLHSMFKNAYAGAAQTLPENKIGSGGAVHVELIENSNNEGFRNDVMDRLPDWISQIQEAGYKASEIAILVRKNREGSEIAKCLMHAKNEGKYSHCNFNFISNESLFIDQHPSIKFLLGLLRYINDPNDQHNNIKLLYFHRTLFNEGESGDAALSPENTILNELGQDFLGMIPELRRIALLDITEKLTEHFNLNMTTDNIPYIQAFQEVVFEMQKRNTCSLHDFLIYWEENGRNKTINVSEQQDAITITTIHKAKGLQYKAVIMPFVGWKMVKTTTGRNQNILWCKTENTPFTEVPAVPLNYSSALSETIFSSYYFEELVLECIDNLNVIYVGFTRAEEVLFMGLQTGDNGRKYDTAGELVRNAVDASFAEAEGNDVFKKEGRNKTFSFGSVVKARKNEAEDNTTSQTVKYPIHTRRDHLRLKLKSKQYLAIDKLSDDPVMYGNLMHEIFAGVVVKNDIDTVVNKYLYEGVISAKQAKDILNYMHAKLNMSMVKDWFSGRYKVVKERDIIIDGKVDRPDRVMIEGDKAIVVDYKFGDKDPTIHAKQVNNYMQRLTMLGYKQLEGYVWYISMDEVIKVEQ